MLQMRPATAAHAWGAASTSSTWEGSIIWVYIAERPAQVPQVGSQQARGETTQSTKDGLCMRIALP